MEDLGEKYGDRRRTQHGLRRGRCRSSTRKPTSSRENTNVVLTRDGWIKRVGRLASVEGTRVREGDEVIAVVPGSTLDHVIFFADDGTAYTMRINEVPASSGYGEPIAKFFRLDDQVKIVAAVTTDPRFVPAAVPAAAAARTAKDEPADPPGPYLLVVTAQGQTLRTPLAPFRVESTKVGRRYVRLNEGDKVVMATVPRDEETHLPGVGQRPRDPLRHRRDQHPRRRRQGRDGHQAGRGRHVPGRGVDGRPFRQVHSGNLRRQAQWSSAGSSMR